MVGILAIFKYANSLHRMKELAKEVMNSVPQYLINFFRMFGSPRQFPLQQLPADEQSTKEALTNALKFALVSLVLIVLLNYYRLDKEVVENIYSELAVLCMGLLAFMVLSTLAVYLAWKILGTKRKFTDYLIVYSYNFGVFFVLMFLSILIANGYLATNDPVAFAEEMGRRHAGIAMDETSLKNPNILTAFFIQNGGIFLAGIWAWIGWGAYRLMNGVSWFRALLALVIAFFLSSLAAWLIQMIFAGMGAI
jgi:hypothetical protein